jgi:hypothetical protein
MLSSTWTLSDAQFEEPHRAERRSLFEVRRFGIALIVLAVALVAALPAAAKEGVTATLTTTIPLDASAGTSLDLAWTLASADGKPFGAGGAFVRLLSATGERAQTGFARGDTGHYAATVRVPEGGIGDVEIGLRGFTSGATGTHRSDLLFPITNDPLPGALQIAAGDSKTWIIALAGGSLCLLAVALLWRLRNSSRFHSRVSLRS